MRNDRRWQASPLLSALSSSLLRKGKKHDAVDTYRLTVTVMMPCQQQEANMRAEMPDLSTHATFNLLRHQERCHQHCGGRLRPGAQATLQDAHDIVHIILAHASILCQIRKDNQGAVFNTAALQHLPTPGINKCLHCPWKTTCNFMTCLRELLLQLLRWAANHPAPLVHEGRGHACPNSIPELMNSKSQ